MIKIALGTLLLICFALPVHSEEQPPELLRHAAQCLEAKQFLASSKIANLTLGYFFDEKSYPDDKVIYIVNYTSAARSSGLIFTLFLREQNGRQEFNIQNNASFVSSTQESSGVSFKNPPLGGTWTQAHLASAIKAMEKQSRFTIPVKDLSSLDASVSCVAYTDPASGQVEKGDAVVTAMHARYENAWYDTVTFTQKSTTYNPDGTTKIETWYEAASLPGKLRIDYGPPSDGNGLLLADGNATSFQAGKETSTRPLLNLLLVLGFDVYRQPPEITVGQLKHEGIDVTKFHEEAWNGQPVYVVGADKGDLKSKQFWVEKKRLLFVRLLQPFQRDPSKTTDTRFVDYREESKGMIAARVEVYREEKLVFTEEYTDIKIGVKLDPATFDPKQFNTTHWEK